MGGVYTAGFSYINSIWHFLLKSVHMHASLHKSRRENHRWVVFTQQEIIYSRAHLVLSNSLVTSLLVLCFSRWFVLFVPPKILLISCHPRLLLWYFLFRYRWAHHFCFLSMNDLSRSSFFDLSIFSELQFQFLFRKFYGISFWKTCMLLYTKVGEKITGGWCLHSRIWFTRAHT